MGGVHGNTDHHDRWFQSRSQQLRMQQQQTHSRDTSFKGRTSAAAT